MDGVSNAEIGVLVVMHALAAAVITRGLTNVQRWGLDNTAGTKE